MKTQIIIKRDGEEITNKECEDCFIIFSDPNGFKGITFFSSSTSLPRQMGWLMWALEFLKWKAKQHFEKSKDIKI